MHDFVFATKGGTGIFSKLNVCQIALAKSSENSLSKEYDSDFCLWRLLWFDIGKGGGVAATIYRGSKAKLWSWIIYKHDFELDIPVIENFPMTSHN